MITPEIGSPIVLTHRGRPIDHPEVRKTLEFEIVAREVGLGENLDSTNGIPWVWFPDKPTRPAMDEALAFASLLTFGGDVTITTNKHSVVVYAFSR